MKIIKFIFIIFVLSIITGCFLNKEKTPIIINQNNQVNLNEIPENIIMTTLKTSKGDIKIKLFLDKAPLAVNNFVSLSKKSFYDNVKFHRVIIDFVIQAGDPQTKGQAGKDFAYDDQPNPSNLPVAGTGGPEYVFDDETTGLLFDSEGILAMANRGPNTNGSQFFITLAATPWLNGKHTIFGKVTEGMDVVKKIERGDWIQNIVIE